MKTLSIDYEIYEKEIKEEYEKGLLHGFIRIAQWLNSENNLPGNQPIKCLPEGSLHWLKDIAKVAGREIKEGVIS